MNNPNETSGQATGSPSETVARTNGPECSRTAQRSQGPAKWLLLPRREDARRDKDGHCTVCGYSLDDWGEDEDDHVCPPGFRWISPELGERPHQLRAERPNDMTGTENSEQAQTSLAACGGSANFVATEPRQITGAPFYYYGYTGKLDAGQHLIWNSLARCCDKKHRGAKAATNCAKKAARRRNSPNDQDQRPAPARET